MSAGEQEEMHVSEAMVVAGVQRLSEMSFLEDPDEIVKRVYAAMDLQRRFDASSNMSRK